MIVPPVTPLFVAIEVTPLFTTFVAHEAVPNKEPVIDVATILLTPHSPVAGLIVTVATVPNDSAVGDKLLSGTYVK